MGKPPSKALPLHAMPLPVSTALRHDASGDAPLHVTVIVIVIVTVIVIVIVTVRWSQVAGPSSVYLVGEEAVGAHRRRGEGRCAGGRGGPRISDPEAEQQKDDDNEGSACEQEDEQGDARGDARRRAGEARAVHGLVTKISQTLMPIPFWQVKHDMMLFKKVDVEDNGFITYQVNQGCIPAAAPLLFARSVEEKLPTTQAFAHHSRLDAPPDVRRTFLQDVAQLAKELGEPLQFEDLDEMTFAICTPGSLRRVFFDKFVETLAEPVAWDEKDL